MRKLVLLMLLVMASSAFGQKFHVKVLKHTVDGQTVERTIPGIITGIGGSVVYAPSRTQEQTLAHIEMLLLLPDGRRVGVYCNDHAIGLAKARTHFCKNPEVDDLDADFSGEKVKLTWGVGLDGTKKKSETYIVGPVYPASENTVLPKP